MRKRSLLAAMLASTLLACDPIAVKENTPPEFHLPTAGL